MKRCALILAGGHGTRFWPWSSELLPKQFLNLAHPSKSLLQQTYERILPLCPAERILVLTNHEYTSLTRQHLPDLPRENILGEPMVKDTAAPVALGSLLAAKRWPDAVQMIIPSDHEIAPDERFLDVLAMTCEAAQDDGKLYAIGLRPSRPTSAYGYLQRGKRLPCEEGFLRCDINAFTEKPDPLTAKKFVDGGLHFWNGGMYIWTAQAAKDAIKRQLPIHAEVLNPLLDTPDWQDTPELLSEAFLKLPKISIDYGMMQAEGASGSVRCVEGDFHWSDLGGWQTFGEKLDPDDSDNQVYGHAMNWANEGWNERFVPRKPNRNNVDEDLSLGDVYTMDAHGNLLFNNRQGHRLAVYGVDDLAVIHTAKATLVTPRRLAEQIKPIVSQLPHETPQGGIIAPRKVEKPWGYELWWGLNDDFAGKTLFLKQGHRFSLQYHVLKEEVIYLQKGRVSLQMARLGDELETVELNEGQGIHVEPGRLHRLTALEDSFLLEVSTAFLWDVVRVSDDFGREGTRTVQVEEE